MPSRTYTYLLNDFGEEFKAKPILMGLFDEPAEETAPTPRHAEAAEPEEAPAAKKGFFSRLFGKK